VHALDRSGTVTGSAEIRHIESITQTVTIGHYTNIYWGKQVPCAANKYGDNVILWNCAKNPKDYRNTSEMPTEKSMEIFDSYPIQS
jgi:hypothetical protein